MILKEVIDKLGAKLLCGEEQLQSVVTGGYCSDLLSDVMGNSKEGQLWITLQVHKNIIAVASLKELSAIVLVNGLKPAEDTITAAKEQGIALVSANESAFEVAGRLYKLIG